MIVVRIVFIGLIAFSPVDDGNGYVAVVADAPGHQTALIQTQGTCKPLDECQRLSGDEQLVVPLRSELGYETYGWAPVRGELMLEDADGDPVDGGVIVQGGTPTTEKPTARYPGDDEEARSFEWVPSIDRMVTGPARIRGACKSGDRGCASSGRFMIQKGRLSTCHLMHELDGDKYPLIYDFGDHEQVVANAVLLEVKVRGDRVHLVVRSMDGAEDLQTVILKPEGNKPITLLLMNEPWPPKPTSEPPRHLEHFPNFYKLLQLFGRGKDYQPMLTGQFGDQVAHACEDDLNIFERILEDSDLLRYMNKRRRSTFPHGGTECDVARIP